MTRKMSRREFVGGTAAAAVAGSLSLGAGRIACAQENVVKVGWIGPMTGPLAAWGLPGTTGCELWAEMTNAAGGINIGGASYQVQVVTYDDQFDPAKAIAGAKKLVGEDGVRFMVQLGGQPTISSQPYLTENKILSSTLTGGDLSPERPYLFVLAEPWPFDVGMSGTWFIERRPEVKKVAMTSMNDPGVLTGLAAYRAAFEQMGVEIVQEKIFTTDTVDFAPIVSALLASKPDALCWGGSFPDFVTLQCIEAYNQGWRGPMVASTAGDHLSIIAKTSTDFMEGFVLCFPDLDDPQLQGPEINFPSPAEFQRVYQERWPASWNEASWYYPAALPVWKAGVEAAGSFETESVVAALRSMETVPHLFGPSNWWGKELYGVDNMLIGRVPVVEIRGGKRTIGDFRDLTSWIDSHFDAVLGHMKDLGVAPAGA